MRLWHEEIISLLPRPQLLAQHRECCALRGAGWGRPHSVVNYVFDHPPYKLFQYHVLVMREMMNRGYNVDQLWMNSKYRGKRAEPYEEETELAEETPIYSEHDSTYLDECLENLAGKGIYLDVKGKEAAQGTAQLLKSSPIIVDLVHDESDPVVDSKGPRTRNQSRKAKIKSEDPTPAAAQIKSEDPAPVAAQIKSIPLGESTHHDETNRIVDSKNPRTRNRKTKARPEDSTPVAAQLGSLPTWRSTYQDETNRIVDSKGPRTKNRKVKARPEDSTPVATQFGSLLTWGSTYRGETNRIVDSKGPRTKNSKTTIKLEDSTRIAAQSPKSIPTENVKCQNETSRIVDCTGPHRNHKPQIKLEDSTHIAAQSPKSKPIVKLESQNETSRIADSTGPGRNHKTQIKLEDSPAPKKRRVPMSKK